MAAQRIEVTAKVLANGKLDVSATANGKVLLRKTCKEPGEAREVFGLTHGQNAHPIYAATYGSNYYLADMLDPSDAEAGAVATKRKARRR